MSKTPAHDVITEPQLIELLGRIDFGERYYAYCDEHAGQTPDAALTHADHQRALDATGLAFKYSSKERFFGHRETHADVTLVLNAVFSRTDLELVLAVIGPKQTVGGTFHGLSYKLMRLAQPDWQHSPKYPRLPFHSFAELGAALGFGIGLYREAQPLILAHIKGADT